MLTVRPALCSVGELFGGVERQLLDLCEYGRRRDGAAPPLIVFHDAELARQARARGFPVTVLAARHRYDPGLAGRLADALRAAGANVVHAHGYKAMIACALARRRAGVAVVKTEHGRAEPTGGDPVVWLKSRLNNRLDTLATRRAAAIVCYVTDDMRRLFAGAHAGLRRVTIPNGVDPAETPAARPAELAPDALQLGVVGRLTPVKGIAVALRALAGLTAARPVRLNIVGEGPLADALAREAARLGVAEQVRFLGFRADVDALIAHFDALLMPSSHEGLPYVLLEAMARGTPVFASRVGGLAEVLRDGETGALFPAGDAAALRALLARLAAEPAWGVALGAAARADQRARFTLAGMGAAYRDIYARAAGEAEHGG
ncbi:MAG: glycosyltransferase [Candidatus Krumholzibacteriia bacterium]